MPFHLTFAQSAQYDASRPGITVSAALKLVNERVEFEAKVDTGATNCIFERQLGEKLGLKIEDGLPKWIGTATGRFLTYEHEVALSVLGFDFYTLACFAADSSFQKNVLGRHGFLMQVKLGIVDYEGKLYLSRHS